MLDMQEETHIYNTKSKINQNQLIVTNGDKGNSLVVLYKRGYNRTEKFTTQNKITKHHP
jgi:hypothetical protein